MSNKNIIVLFVVLLATAFAFQNCGSFSSGSESENSGAQQNPGQNIVPFSAGQAYDPTIVPANPDNQEFMDQINSYASNTSAFKAIAINADGDGLASTSNEVGRVIDQDEWNKVVLERCQLSYSNKPCSLFAEGDLVKYDHQDFLNGYTDMFANHGPGPFDLNKLPGSIDFWNQTKSDYLLNLANDFKAIAVNASGTAHVGWSLPKNGNNNAIQDQAEANRRALEFCESIRYGRQPCFLHTIGADTVWDPSNTQWQPISLKFAPNALVVDEVPFITEQTRENRIRPAVANFNANGGPNFIIVMGRFGRYASVFTTTATIDNNSRQQALDACDTDYIGAFPANQGEFQETCFIYSENLQVVMTPDSYGRAVHSWHPDNRN